MKSVPRQSVISPVCAPLMHRRPSGCHATALTAQRTRFWLLCANLQARLVAGEKG